MTVSDHNRRGGSKERMAEVLSLVLKEGAEL